MQTSSTGDTVVQLHVRRKYRYLWVAITAAVVVGSALAVLFARSWTTIAYASAMLALFGWIWLLNLAERRLRAGAPAQLVLTKDGIRSPAFALDWDRVARVWIGVTSAQTASLPTLFIEPIRGSDVRWVPSRTIAANRWLSDRMRLPQLRVLQANVDIPLEDLLAEMERQARRSLS